jgi:hypothetical protein
LAEQAQKKKSSNPYLTHHLPVDFDNLADIRIARRSGLQGVDKDEQSLYFASEKSATQSVRLLTKKRPGDD